MKISFRMTLLLVALGLALLGCPNPTTSQLLTPDMEAKLVDAGDGVIEITRATLIAGRTIPVGTVEVSMSEGIVYITYTVNDEWALAETHLAVVFSPDDIPHTSSGNFKPGHFEYKASHDPAVTSFTYDVGSYDPETVLYIAAYADLGSESAWAQEDELTQTKKVKEEGRGGKNWATYFSFTIP